jgi:hypothetical protein
LQHLRAVQVAKQADLRAVGHRLAVQVYGQGGHGVIGERPSLGAERAEEGVVVEGRDAVAPEGVALLEECEAAVRGQGEWLGPVALIEHIRVVGGIRTAEERPRPFAEHVLADVCHPPRDSGDRRDRRLGNHGLDADQTVVALAERPRAGDGLPQVLVIGQALQARLEVEAPVEVELIQQEVAPHRRHGSIVALARRNRRGSVL